MQIKNAKLKLNISLVSLHLYNNSYNDKARI